jgi:hypothetical protein
MAAGGCDVLSVQVHGDAVVRTVEERGTKKPEGVACEVNIHVPDGNVGLTVEQTATKKVRVPGKDLRTRPVAAQVGEGRILKGHHNGGTSLRRVVLFFLAYSNVTIWQSQRPPSPHINHFSSILQQLGSSSSKPPQISICTTF